MIAMWSIAATGTLYSIMTCAGEGNFPEIARLARRLSTVATLRAPPESRVHSIALGCDERAQRALCLIVDGGTASTAHDINFTTSCYPFSTWLDNIFSTGLILVSKLTFFSTGSGMLRTQSLISASKSSGPGVSTLNFEIWS